MQMDDNNITNETRLTRVQALVVDILNDLLRAPIEATDETIQSAIARIGAWCRRDRSYVFVKRGDAIFNTHEWCGLDVEPAIDYMQGIPWEGFGPITEPLEKGQPFYVPDVNELDPEAASRALLEMQNINSMLLVPMRHEGLVYGFIGFDGIEATQPFLPGELYLLQSVADVIYTVLTRRDREQAVARAQAELADERSFLASVLATPAMGVMVIDAAGVIRFVNEAACRVTGVRRERLLGSRHDDPRWQVMHADGAAFTSEELPFNRVMATGLPVADVRMRQPFASGDRYMSVHAAPLEGGGMGDARVVYAVLEVTDQILAARAREEALEEARRASAAKSNFLAKMSHEMRTPLNGVLGIAQVLERKLVEPDLKQMVRVLSDSGSLLLGIINDLLDMTKIEADKLEIEAIPFSVVELGQRIESVHTLKASERQLSFGVRLRGDCDAPRLGDPFRIMQVLHNLIGNAIKFTEEGEVSVTIDCVSASMLELVVEDSGIGMTEEEQRLAVEEFGQADSSITRRFGGTGLGMSIVRGLVQMMGGQIRLFSQPGIGTRVEVSLPVGIAHDVADAAPNPAAGGQICAAEADGRAIEPGFDTSGIGDLRVLAADDNRTNRMILESMLGQFGISATTVADGAAALRMLSHADFDLVVLDISMPGLDGLAVMRELRRRLEASGCGEGDPPPPRIVAFTANAMSHQVEAYLQAGFDDCLTKPLKLSVLSKTLHAALPERRAKQPSPHCAQIGV